MVPPPRDGTAGAFSTLIARLLIFRPTRSTQQIAQGGFVPMTAIAPTATALVARPQDVLAGPVGSFDAYMDKVSRIPVLSREDEAVLAHRFRNEGDLDAARQLVMSHRRLVVHISRVYSGYGLPLGDVVQEGNVGLMKAVKRFDPNVG